MFGNTIVVCEREFAFTSDSAKIPEIITTGAGPCFVVTGKATNKDGRTFVGLAHIDDITDVGTLTKLFDRFKECQIANENISVVVLGGWKEQGESKKWGDKILNLLSTMKIVPQTKYMYHKKMLPQSLSYKLFQQDSKDLTPYYFHGLKISAVTGKTQVLQESCDELKKIKSNKILRLMQEQSLSPNREDYPLKEVIL